MYNYFLIEFICDKKIDLKLFTMHLKYAFKKHTGP